MKKICFLVIGVLHTNHSYNMDLSTTILVKPEHVYYTPPLGYQLPPTGTVYRNDSSNKLITIISAIIEETPNNHYHPITDAIANLPAFNPVGSNDQNYHTVNENNENMTNSCCWLFCNCLFWHCYHPF